MRTNLTQAFQGFPVVDVRDRNRAEVCRQLHSGMLEIATIPTPQIGALSPARESMALGHGWASHVVDYSLVETRGRDEISPRIAAEFTVRNNGFPYKT